MQTNHNQQKLMTPDEVAALLDVSVDTLAVWRCTRRYPLPFIKVGRNVRYRREAIEQFLDGQTVCSPQNN